MTGISRRKENMRLK